MKVTFNRKTNKNLKSKKLRLPISHDLRSTHLCKHTPGIPANQYIGIEVTQINPSPRRGISLERSQNIGYLHPDQEQPCKRSNSTANPHRAWGKHLGGPWNSIVVDSVRIQIDLFDPTDVVLSASPSIERSGTQIQTLRFCTCHHREEHLIVNNF